MDVKLFESIFSEVKEEYENRVSQGRNIGFTVTLLVSGHEYKDSMKSFVEFVQDAKNKYDVPVVGFYGKRLFYAEVSILEGISLSSD